MISIPEGDLIFQFDDQCSVGKYDDWAFYRNQFSHIKKSKAVYFVCRYGNDCCLVEVKDYRVHPRTKPSELSDEVAQKVRDTLAGLSAAQHNAQGEERRLARKALRSRRWRVLLHLEQPQYPSRLRPKPIDLANLTIKLKQVLRAIDRHPAVANASNPRGPWSIETNPTTSNIIVWESEERT